MNTLTRSTARISLGKVMILLSAASLAFALLLILAISEVVRTKAIQDLAHDEARDVSRMAFESLYSVMRKGWNKQEINEVIARLDGSLPGTKVRAFRGAAVTRQFGAIPGEQALVDADPALSQALSTGQEALLFPDRATIRYLYPILAGQECLSCHSQSTPGAVQGVIEVVYPIDNLKVAFNYVIDTVVGYSLLVLGFALVSLYYLLRRLVVSPISNLVGIISQVTEEMNLEHRVSGSAWILEVGLLADYFNRLLSTVQDYNQRLEELSVRDPLTGLYNRRKFQEFMRHEIIRTTRHGRGFSVIMIDLDNFKYINDTFGHPIGDMVLKELSAMLLGGLRQGDVLARMGGDEFAIILPETPAGSGLQVANKLHQELAGRTFELPIGKILCTASFSMVSFPDDGKTEEEICTAMDVVLYKAKSRGKNQVMTAEGEADRSMMTIYRQGDFLRKALLEERVEAHLQPIVAVSDGSIVAFEVLVRIRDGEAVIAAGEFVEVAEELGMAKELDREVFRQGLAHYAKVSARHPQAKFFFNLFPRSFNDIEWIRGIPELLRGAGVPCDSVVLEITEREALPNLTQVRTVIEELRESKIAVALDDFGSGFSSFLYLKFLSIDYVKIEGSFVRQIAVDARDRIIVEQINSMAHRFGLKTIAEFVEDAETARVLAEIGVDFAQGYYCGRPALPQ